MGEWKTLTIQMKNSSPIDMEETRRTTKKKDNLKNYPNLWWYPVSYIIQNSQPIILPYYFFDCGEEMDGKNWNAITNKITKKWYA
jgi:hypothetical protein